MTETLIKAVGLTKRFSRDAHYSQADVRRRVAHALLGRRVKPTETLGETEFFAVKNLNFDARRGEAVGIIGENGAGKTTLLKTLAGILGPDSGALESHGRIVTLMDLSNGMQGNLSGRENIYVKGSLNGLSQKEIRRHEDDIIRFSELEDAIDAPFKTYSSGMRMRLAFAINIHSDADIFLVDEVLAVGDFKFRQKCMEHMQRIAKSVALVIVSHSMNDILRFCNKCIIIKAGEATYFDDVNEATAVYSEAKNKAAQSKEN